MMHYQGYYINNVIRIELLHSSQNDKQSKGVEYVGRSGRMIGMADDGTLILMLYPLEGSPSGDNQKEKVDEGDANTEEKVDEESTWAGDSNQDGEVLEQSEPTIVYIDRELAVVVLWVSLQDFLQLIAVEDPKQDRGEVTKVYDNGFVQRQLINGVSVEC